MKDQDRIERLPKWAQSLISDQGASIKRLTRELTQEREQTTEDSPLTARADYLTPAYALPVGTRVTLTKENGTRLNVEVNDDLDGFTIDVQGSFDSIIAVQPVVSNVVKVRALGRQ